MARETITLEILYEDDKLTKGIAHSTEKVKKAGKEWQEVFKGMFASAAVQKGIELTKQGLREISDLYVTAVQRAGDLSQSYTRLNTSLERQNSSVAEQSDNIRTVIDDMREYAGVGENTVVNMLAKMINFTGDYDKAVMALKPTLDLAASGMMDLDSAGRNIGRTFGGFAGELQEIIPQLKALTPEMLKSGEGAKLVGTLFGGQATAAMRQFSGSLVTLTNSWEDLLAIMGGPSAEVLSKRFNDISDILSEWSKSDSAGRVADSLGRIASNIGKAAVELTGGTAGAGFVENIEKLLDRLEGYTETKLLVDLQNAVGLASKLVALIEKASRFSGYAERINTAVRKYSVQGVADEFFGDTDFDSTAFDFFSSQADKWLPRAKGGGVPGPNRGDTVPAMLSGEEYVLNPQARHAMDRHFPGFLDDWNFNKYPAGSSGPGLAQGGGAEQLITSLENTFGGQDFGPALGTMGRSRTLNWVINSIRNSDPAQLLIRMDQELAKKAVYLGAHTNRAIYHKVRQWAKTQLGPGQERDARDAWRRQAWGAIRGRAVNQVQRNTATGAWTTGPVGREPSTGRTREQLRAMVEAGELSGVMGIMEDPWTKGSIGKTDPIYKGEGAYVAPSSAIGAELLLTSQLNEPRQLYTDPALADLLKQSGLDPGLLPGDIAAGVNVPQMRRRPGMTAEWLRQKLLEEKIPMTQQGLLSSGYNNILDFFSENFPLVDLKTFFGSQHTGGTVPGAFGQDMFRRMQGGEHTIGIHDPDHPRNQAQTGGSAGQMKNAFKSALKEHSEENEGRSTGGGGGISLRIPHVDNQAIGGALVKFIEMAGVDLEDMKDTMQYRSKFRGGA